MTCLMPTGAWRSCFEQIFDVAVVGTGYAGYGAARSLAARDRSVLLVDRGSDLLWESGRAMAFEAGWCDQPLWNELFESLGSRGAAMKHDGDGAELDGAGAEIIVSHQLLQSDIRTLYYAAPVAVEIEHDALVGLIVATRGGLRRVVARQWIDATERGELLTLIERHTDTETPRRTARQQRLHVAIHHHDWPEQVPARIEPAKDCADLAGATLSLCPTMWPSQRMLCIELPGHREAGARWAGTIRGALESLHAAVPATMRDVVVSHMSLVPLEVYDGEANGGSMRAPGVHNVVLASSRACAARLVTLADRFALGLDAADRSGDPGSVELPGDALERTIEPVEPTRTLGAEVVVAGAGTGGALAAVAAARSGADVLCIEPMPFPGGIGAGGGIHHYYFGVPGGLQAELDERVKTTMSLFGSPAQVRGFHPEAKKVTLLEMMSEAGVRFVPYASAFAAQTHQRRVTRMLASHLDGPMSIEAQAWIDATGDGDLCALAGARFHKGRPGDGLLHAYSQSAGNVALFEHKGQSLVRTGASNFDAGWVDPTDSEDLTRARLVGICQYLRDDYDPWSRRTYIAPAIGLRQGRQVEAAYMLTLTDLIERRHFPDVIGFTGANYDNHAVDYEFESDEALFWVWLCRQWRAPLASELPYRMIVPRDLDNVWIGSRALGVTQDAHHCCRMQRDMQRVGEVAGHAAALAVRHGTAALDVPIKVLQRKLTESEAIKLDRLAREHPFNDRAVDLTLLAEPAADHTEIDSGLARLSEGAPHPSLWHLYRAREAVGERVRACLNSDDPRVSWLAAGICAMWGESAAEPRLLAAIRTREYGYDEVTDQHIPLRRNAEGPRPEKHHGLVPNWLAAISLLRCCGTDAALPTLLDLARQPKLILNARTGIAVTVERLVHDGRVDRASVPPELIDALLASEVSGSVVEPRRRIGQILQQQDAPQPLEPAVALSSDPGGITSPQQSLLWQLHLVVARLCRLLDMPMPEVVKAYRHDQRRRVREAFAQALTEPTPESRSTTSLSSLA